MYRRLGTGGMLTGGQTGGRAGGQEDRLAGGRERANGRTRGECRAIILIRRLNTAVRIKWHLALVPSLMACRTDKVGETARAHFFLSSSTLAERITDLPAANWMEKQAARAMCSNGGFNELMRHSLPHAKRTSEF